jgi:hypothetical protein
MREIAKKPVLAALACAAVLLCAAAQAADKDADPRWKLETCLQEAIQLLGDEDDDELIRVIDGPGSSSHREPGTETIQNLAWFVFSCVRQLDAEAGDLVDPQRPSKGITRQRVVWPKPAI